MVAVRAWLFALLATLLVLLPNGAAGHAEHYCRMTGRVVESCCCGDTARPAPPSSGQRVQVEGCCQRISSANQSASLGLQKALGSVAPAALSAHAVEPLGALPRASVGGQCAESTQAPLAIGPPLFVKHCALLS